MATPPSPHPTSRARPRAVPNGVGGEPGPGRSFRSEPTRADLHLGYAIVRAIFGLNIAMHGLSRFGDLGGFVDGVTKGFASTMLPEVLVRTVAWTIAPLEALVGVALVLGLATRKALVSGALLMAALTFGVTLQQRWDVAGLQLTYVVVYGLLVAGLAYNRLSLDHWLAGHAGGRQDQRLDGHQEPAPSP